MAIVNFENLPSENTPLTGGASGNLNVMQENGTTHGSDTKLGYSQSFLNDHIVNISNEVDEDYRVNIIYSNNMINIETNTDNYYLDSTGTPQSNSSWYYTDYIKVEEGQKIYITGNLTATAGSGVYMCFYNSSKAFVSSLAYANYKEDNTMINIPSGVSYLRMSGRIENESTAKIYIPPAIYVDNEEIYNQNIMNYSTGEIKIGTWIDGKPLYRKTVSCGALPNNTSKTINTNINNISRVVRIYGYSFNGTSTFFPLPHSNPNPVSLSFYKENNTNGITIQTTIDRSSFTETYVSIEYTKTTD